MLGADLDHSMRSICVAFDSTGISLLARLGVGSIAVFSTGKN